MLDGWNLDVTKFLNQNDDIFVKFWMYSPGTFFLKIDRYRHFLHFTKNFALPSWEFAKKNHIKNPLAFEKHSTKNVRQKSSSPSRPWFEPAFPVTVWDMLLIGFLLGVGGWGGCLWGLLCLGGIDGWWSSSVAYGGFQWQPPWKSRENTQTSWGLVW